jgi:hypothetical protein
VFKINRFSNFLSDGLFMRGIRKQNISSIDVILNKMGFLELPHVLDGYRIVKDNPWLIHIS